MSHDFRTTLITDMYRESNNIVACQTYVGHKHVNTTRGYIKTTNEDVEGALRELRKGQKGMKRQRKD